MKSVLLTRSAEDNYDIIRMLESKYFALGQAQLLNHRPKFQYICSPLIKYRELGFNPAILYDYNNIIITSKVATKLFISQFSKHQNSVKQIWVVGDSSNIILRQHNFTVAYKAQNIQELIENIPTQLYKQSIYLSSNEITQDLPSAIKRQIIYEVQYANTLHHIEEIKKGVDYILLYSQNSAKTLVTLLKQNNLLELFFSTKLITISEKVATIIRFFTKNVIYCNEGKPEEMLILLTSQCSSIPSKNI